MHACTHARKHACARFNYTHPDENAEGAGPDPDENAEGAGPDPDENAEGAGPDPDENAEGAGPDPDENALENAEGASPVPDESAHDDAEAAGAVLDDCALHHSGSSDIDTEYQTSSEEEGERSSDELKNMTSPSNTISERESSAEAQSKSSSEHQSVKDEFEHSEEGDSSSSESLSSNPNHESEENDLNLVSADTTGLSHHNHPNLSGKNNGTASVLAKDGESTSDESVRLQQSVPSRSRKSASIRTDSGSETSDASNPDDDLCLENPPCDNEQELRDQVNDIYSGSSDSEASSGEEDGHPLQIHQQPEHPHQTETAQACGFQTLREKLQKNFKTPILETPKASRGEVLLNALVYSKKNHLNFSAQQGLMQLINSIFQSDVVPSTKYHLDKLFSSSVGVSYHFYCKHCFQYLCKRKNNEKGEKFIVCPVCKVQSQIADLNSASFFVTLDIPGQLELILNDPEVVKSGWMNPADILSREEGSMTDLYDGIMYRKFAASLEFTNFQHVSFCFSDDGTPLFRESSFSVWPIFLSVLELPPLLRFSKLLLGGLWFGQHPKQDLFLKPLIDHTQNLSEVGFKIILSGKETKMKGHLLCCCADAPARAAIQLVHQFNGECGCNWCMHPGETLENTRNVRVYPNLYDIPPKRTKQEIFEDGSEAFRKGQKDFHVNGVLGVSPLLASKSCDIVDGMIVEFLHLAARGVPSQLTGAWFGSDGREVPYYIGEPLSVDKVEHLLKKIRPPIEARRFPRSISDMSFWKARDWENWVLYYSLPILNHFHSVLLSDEDILCEPMPSRYIKHWAKFVEAVHLIMQSTISYADIDQAHVLLTEFVAEIEELYSKKHMTYNVHILLHLCENVARWGPPWAISAYCFEDWNSTLKDLIHANRGIASQVLRGIFHEYAIKIMQSEVGSTATQRFEENFNRKKIKSFMRVDDCTVLGKCCDFVPSEFEKYLCNQEGIDAEDFVECPRVVKSKCVYSGRKDRRGGAEKRSNNSSAVLISGERIYIRKIIASQQKNKCYFVASNINCQPFRYKPNALQNSALNFVNFVEEDTKLVPLSAVRTICAQITLSETEQYVVNVPNLYNVN